MEPIGAWLGDLYELPGVGREWVGLICIVASAFCGAVIGIERERRDKPAGLRTLILIAVGSSIFTLISLLLGERKPVSDPARLASQIIPGVGFLGAGAIIRAHGAVRGLTTGATIWATAAVGVVVGAGYVAAGLTFTLIILLTLTAMRWVELFVSGRCSFATARIDYRPDNGKTKPRLQGILDQYAVPDEAVADAEVGDDARTLQCRICVSHREHRGVLKEIAEVAEVLSIRTV